MTDNQESACVANINSLRTRRILTLSFNDGIAGVLYTDVLVYLTVEYLKQFQNYKSLTKHEGFMVKTHKDVEMFVGISSTYKVGLIYKGLEAAGLITLKKKGQDNRTCVKVNLRAIDDRLAEYEPQFEKMTSDYVEEQKRFQNKRKDKSFDLEKVNNLTDKNDFEELKESIKDHNRLSLIYGVNHYYKQFTGKAFVWRIGDLNTMLQPWKDRWSYKGAELGLAIAVYRAIHDNSNLYFGQKFKQYFSIQLERNDIPEGVVFDNIFQIEN